MSGERRTVAVCTIVRGRQAHLSRLLTGLTQQSLPADVVVVAWMGGPDPRPAIPDGLPVTIVDVADDRTPLPLSRARNAARRAAGDVDIVIFLDVDVIPSEGLVADYLSRCVRTGGLWSGQVDYLPEGVPECPSWTADELDRAAEPHPARTPPPSDVLLDDPSLFWSLSFAIQATDFDRIGGFDEDFVGYGGEDTDFGWRAHRGGVALWRTATARGWHQHHTSESPPVQHLRDIVGNATHFRRKWGVWPMEGWLHEFSARGLVTFDPESDVLELR